MAEPGIDIAGDLAEIEIVSFETAERKPEEAEVERVEVRALWCGLRAPTQRRWRRGHAGRASAGPQR